jgi:hypothetical protein
MDVTLVVNREDARRIEEEERNKFLKNVLINIGLDEVLNIWPDIELNGKQKKLLSEYLAKYNLVIDSDHDRSYSIINVSPDGHEEVIAEWKKPFFVLKVDNKAKTLAKKIYYEMTLSCWSVFDEGEDNG